MVQARGFELGRIVAGGWQSGMAPQGPEEGESKDLTISWMWDGVKRVTGLKVT